jgi:hypothetical protein
VSRPKLLQVGESRSGDGAHRRSTKPGTDRFKQIHVVSDGLLIRFIQRRPPHPELVGELDVPHHKNTSQYIFVKTNISSVLRTDRSPASLRVITDESARSRGTPDPTTFSCSISAGTLGDLNGDGVIAAADLGLLIGNWTPCP